MTHNEALRVGSRVRVIGGAWESSIGKFATVEYVYPPAYDGSQVIRITVDGEAGTHSLAAFDVERCPGETCPECDCPAGHTVECSRHPRHAAKVHVQHADKPRPNEKTMCAQCGASPAPCIENRCMLHYGGQTVQRSANPEPALEELAQNLPEERALRVLPKHLEGVFWNDVRKRLATEFRRLCIEEHARAHGSETPEPRVMDRDWKVIAEALMLAQETGETLASIRARFGLDAPPAEKGGAT